VKTKYDQERTYGIGAVFRYVSDMKDYMVVHAGVRNVLVHMPVHYLLGTV